MASNISADATYKEYCASCHGEQLQGGMGGTLLNPEWVNGRGDSYLNDVITNGIPDKGMPGWSETLTTQQVRALIVFINEVNARVTPELSPKNNGGQFSAAGHDFSLTVLAKTDGIFWGMDFLPDGSVLVTERAGKLWHIHAKGKTLIKNTPEVWAQGQGGLLDVAVHPDYAKNGWIYLSFADDRRGGNKATGKGMTKIVRGKIRNDGWSHEEVIFSADKKHHTGSQYHFGSRFAIADGYLFFGVGDRGAQDLAQDLGRPNGKVFRLHDDGRIPKDNPFIKDKNALPEIWSYGHRNPQGMAIEPSTGLIWAAEHGPRGGDEINIVSQGHNYGWPLITYGINYNGTPITDKTHLPGMQQPIHYWTPSIAVSDIEFYSGEPFSAWQGKLLVSSLKEQELRLLTIQNRTVTEEQTLLSGQGRIRDVATAPNGEIYLLVSRERAGAGQLIKMTAVKP